MNDEVVAQLCALSGGPRSGPGRRRPLPSRDVLVRVVSDLRAVLFPWHFGPPGLTEEDLHYYLGYTLHAVCKTLEEQIHRGLTFADDVPEPTCDARAREVTRALVQRLPHIRETLGTDARAAFDNDPAARSTDEAVFCYPGMNAMAHHRIAHELYRLDVSLIARMIAELAHSATGIDIHPGASIGERFFIDHGTGVVIGETCVIGNGVRLFQGVTLGAKSFPTDAQGHAIKGLPRHPIVEDDVVVYAGATILGRVRIGRGSTVGANVWVTQDVPPGTRVTQTTVIRDVFTDGAGI